MKGFLQEYGIIMVVVAVVLGMLAFGKTGYAKSIQDAILGSANHIVETGENITKKKAGDLLKIEGKEYIVIEEKEKDKVLVMLAKDTPSYGFYFDAFNNKVRPDGQYSNTYENSDADKYLENTWYKGLSTKMQSAIQTSNIKQASYYGEKQETGYNGQVYNTISRHVFLPSVEEIKAIVDVNNKEKVKSFLTSSSPHYLSVWTRDSSQGSPTYVINLTGLNSLYRLSVDSAHYNGLNINPTFVIDLSKVDYTEVGHVDYK